MGGKRQPGTAYRPAARPRRQPGTAYPPPRARGEPTPPAPTEAPTETEFAAAQTVMAMTGMMCAMGFLPAMRGPTARGWRRGVSRPPAQARGSNPPRPPPPGIVTEIDGLRFVDGVLVDAPWYNKRRVAPRAPPPAHTRGPPSEPLQAPAQDDRAGLPAGPDPPPGARVQSDRAASAQLDADPAPVPGLAPSPAQESARHEPKRTPSGRDPPSIDDGCDTS